MSRESKHKFSKGDTEVANKHVERWSASFSQQGMKIQIIRQHLTLIHNDNLTNENNKHWQGCGKPAPLIHTRKCSCFGK